MGKWRQNTSLRSFVSGRHAHTNSLPTCYCLSCYSHVGPSGRDAVCGSLDSWWKNKQLNLVLIKALSARREKAWLCYWLRILSEWVVTHTTQHHHFVLNCTKRETETGCAKMHIFSHILSFIQRPNTFIWAKRLKTGEERVKSWTVCFHVWTWTQEDTGDKMKKIPRDGWRRNQAEEW